MAANLQSQGEETAKVREQVREMEDHIALLVEYRDALEAELDVEVMG